MGYNLFVLMPVYIVNNYLTLTDSNSHCVSVFRLRTDQGVEAGFCQTVYIS